MPECSVLTKGWPRLYTTVTFAFCFCIESMLNQLWHPDPSHFPLHEVYWIIRNNVLPYYLHQAFVCIEEHLPIYWPTERFLHVSLWIHLNNNLCVISKIQDLVNHTVILSCLWLWQIIRDSRSTLVVPHLKPISSRRNYHLYSLFASFFLTSFLSIWCCQLYHEILLSEVAYFGDLSRACWKSK